MRRLLCIGIVALILSTLVSARSMADDAFKKEELDQMLAPIALYPDELLTNVLIASTYPLDVVQASRWRQNPANAKLKGTALTQALEAQPWDPSIKALVQFPDVLKTMSDKLDWTQKLGDAFLAQQNDVMDEIQFLRAKADEAGHLKSTKQQKVVKESGSSGKPVYIIQPTASETVYVPVYQPTVVYGSWWYPSYPPYYWTYPGASFVNGFFWGAGVAVAADIWGWNHFDWHHHDIDIDVNKWNNINVNRDKLVNNKWEYRPDHRGPVPYRNKDVRDKFKQAGREPIGNTDFRGRDRAEIQDRLKGTDHARIDSSAGKDLRDKIPDKAGNAIKDRAGDGAANKIKDRGGDRIKAQNADRAARTAGTRNKPNPGAFDVKRGSDARRNAERGRASRVAMPQGAHLGGGGRHPGGGHHVGGRRR